MSLSPSGGTLSSCSSSSGGTISDHIPVNRNSYENIVWDVIETQRGKKAIIAK